MVSMQGGHFVPIPFAQMLDPETGPRPVRLVDIHSTRYAIARRYMIRLRRDDFEDPHELAKFAATAGMSLEEFRRGVRVPHRRRAAAPPLEENPFVFVRDSFLFRCPPPLVGLVGGARPLLVFFF